MALLTLNFESEFLKGNTEIHVIMPDREQELDAKKFYTSGKLYPVLWLLHGGGGDYSDWIRKTKLELYACENELVVVTFSGCNTMYANWKTFADGMDYERFFFEELMPFIYGWLPVSPAKTDNFIAGLSMGGAGALKFAIWHPELFYGCACLSSSGKKYSLRDMDFETEVNPVENQKRNAVLNAGGSEKFYYSWDNIRLQLKRLAERRELGILPDLFISCGKADHHYEEVNDFMEYTSQLGVAVEYEFIPEYRHEWRFWDLAVQHALKHFGFSTRIQE